VSHKKESVVETEDSMICEKCKQKAEVGVTGRSAAPYRFLCLGCASEPQPDSTRTFTLSTRMVHGVIEDFLGGHTMRFPRYVSQSAAFALFMITVGCAGFDGGRSHSEAGRASPPVPVKDARNLGTPIEKDFGYAQAVKIGDTIYVSGQLSLDEKGTIHGTDMETQLWQVYANIVKVLGLYGARLKDDVVEEIIYVTDMQTALAVAPKVRLGAYSGPPQVASTIIQVAHLSVPDALVEIKVTAKAPPSLSERQGSSERSSQGSRGGGMGGGRRGGMGFPF
jgi:enamine deaminase RidA (YjgF/YER057c/UK114 family)